MSLSEHSSSDQNRLITSAAEFITSQGPAIHTGLAGSSHYSEERQRFIPMDSFSSLEQLLKHYLPENHGLEFENNIERLEQISEKLIDTQRVFSARDSRWWHSLWRNIGDEKFAIEGWIALIPNEYGLAVVKTGLAVVFKLAERSAERATKILQVFSSIRDALTRADPTKRSFRGNKDVGAMADSLTETIVDSIEDMILLTTKKRTSWRKRLSQIPKFSQKEPPPDLDEILAKIEKSTGEFERVVTLVRDRTIEITGYMAHSMTTQLSVVQGDIHGAKETLERLIEKEELRYQDSTSLCKLFCNVLHQIAERENAMQNSQLEARNGLMEVLKQSQMNRKEIKRLRQQISRASSHNSMITEDELFRILLNSYSDLAELSPQLQQPNKDLSRVLSNKGRHSEDIQLEVQTFLLRHERTREWMESVDSDVIVVDARLYNASMPKISAASVFSASLITSLINASEDAVVVHYFCGIHFLPRDEFFGPSGLIRFITMQLLLSLVASQSVDLGFIDSKEFIRDLEDQELSRLCDLLYLIIDQFPEDITIWCVIDSIQRLDKPATSADLRFAMEFLHDLIDDTRLRPTVKVFMISLNHNKKTFTDLPIFQTDPSRIITLRPTGAKATRRLCDQAISDQLSRALPYRGSRRSAEY